MFVKIGICVIQISNLINGEVYVHDGDDKKEKYVEEHADLFDYSGFFVCLLEILFKLLINFNGQCGGLSLTGDLNWKLILRQDSLIHVIYVQL